MALLSLLTISGYNSKKEISMLPPPQRHFMLLACLLVAPGLGISSTITGIQASGSVPTTCGYGSCTAGALSLGALTFGNSTTGSYNFDVTAADGDVYDVAGTFNNTFPSTTFLGFFPTVTYVGTTPAASADTITLDMFQDFVYGSDSTNSWSGPYNEKVPVDLSISGTTATGQVFYSSDVDPTAQSVGLLPTADGPGDYFLSGSATLGPLDGDLLIGDLQLTLTFPAGAPPGSSISSPVPEPTQTIPVTIGLAGLLLFKLRKFRSRGNRA
jgi:hypothetical protein